MLPVGVAGWRYEVRALSAVRCACSGAFVRGRHCVICNVHTTVRANTVTVHM